ncbi:MAG: hypothetical protein WCK53_01080 [Methanomicrobiales archaeon]
MKTVMMPKGHKHAGGKCRGDIIVLNALVIFIIDTRLLGSHRRLAA